MICKILIIFLLLDINSSNSVSNKSVEKPITTRIIGGYECKNVHSNVNTKFLINLTGYWGNHICGGSLISSRWILTAAHCANFKLFPIFVIDAVQRDKWFIPFHGLGFLDWFAPIHRIRKIYVHPDFIADEHNVRNDIALLFLYKPIQESENIQFVKLPDSTISGDVSNVCKDGTVIGWGQTDRKNPFSLPKKLMCADLKIETYEECLRIVKESVLPINHSFTIPTNAICTEPNFEKDACYGDSGGPLICGGVQYGIASFITEMDGTAETHTICANGGPTFYTRVDKYLDFIYETMKNNVLPKSPLNILVILLFNSIFYILI